MVSETDKSAMQRFLQDTITLGTRIQTDSKNAKDLLEQIKKGTDFQTIIEQKDAQTQAFLNQCHSFAQSIEDWKVTYPKLLVDFRAVLQLVIEDLKTMPGLTLSINGQQVNIGFNETTFVYNFNKEYDDEPGALKIADDQKKLIAQKEHKIVQEISEIIALDFHISAYLEYIETRIKLHNIDVAITQVKVSTHISDAGLINGMNILTLWWKDLSNMLDQLKKVVFIAVEMDKKVAKQLDTLFNEENRLNLRDKQLHLAKGGLLILTRIALNFIPFGGIVSTIIEVRDLKKLAQEALTSLK